MTEAKKPTQMEMEEILNEVDPHCIKMEDLNNITIGYKSTASIIKLNQDTISPSHYKLPSGLEVKDIMKDVIGVENVKQFYKGNIIKYILRADKKNGLEDYKKAKRYIEMLEELENEY